MLLAALLVAGRSRDKCSNAFKALNVLSRISAAFSAVRDLTRKFCFLWSIEQNSVCVWKFCCVICALDTLIYVYYNNREEKLPIMQEQWQSVSEQFHKLLMNCYEIQEDVTMII